jgi:signal peptidase
VIGKLEMRDLLRNETVQTIILMAIIVASFAVFWFGLRTALRTDHPFLAVASGSMEPVLYRGDLIMVQGVVNACDIKAGYEDSAEPGDIIIFHEWKWHNGDLIVHRAVEKKIEGESCSFRTQGDIVNGHHPDGWGWVKESDIVGRYMGKVPLLGHVPLFMREVAFPFLSTPVGFIIVILVILVLLFMDYIPLKKKEAEA